MIRNFKAMGLAVVAVLAMSALVASSASAQFEAETVPVTVTTSSNSMQKFAVAVGQTPIECTTLKSKGTQSVTPSTTFTTHPEYSNCETFLGQEVTVNTTGCNYVFHVSKGSTSGTTDVECEAGKTIVITVGSICTYTIGTQTGLSSVSFKNTGSGTTREIIVEPNVTGIKSTLTTNDFFCPTPGSGTYTGNSVSTGENSAGTAHIGIFVD